MKKPTKTKPKSKGNRYPWGDWFEPGRKTVLKKGKDFTCQVHGMMLNIRQATCRYGMQHKVHLQVVDDTITMSIDKEGKSAKK